MGSNRNQLPMQKNSFFQRFNGASAQPGAFRGLALATFLLFASSLAWAVAIPTSADILGKTQATDQSVIIFTHLLGAFFSSPLSSLAGSPGLIGSMFLVFNTCVFVVGMLWAGYGILLGIVETSETGEVLGKKLSATWLPIRMVTGIGGIVPVFAGYSLSQVFIVTMTGLGIGIANAMWYGAIEKMNEFTALSPPGIMAQGSGGVDFTVVAKDLFAMHTCTLSMQESQAQQSDQGLTPQAQDVVTSKAVTVSGGTSAIVSSGSISEPNLCGQATVKRVGRAGARGEGIMSFSVASVDYKAYSDAIASGYASNLLSLNAEIETLTKFWYAARVRQNNARGSPVVPVPTAQIDSLGLKYADLAYKTVKTQSKAMETKASSGLTRFAEENMKKIGWLGAGSWFSTIAEANAAASDAIRASFYDFKGPNNSSSFMSQGTKNTLNEGVGVSENAVKTGDQESSTMDQIMYWIAKKVGVETGNISLGQGIIRSSINLAKGSGGGDLVNPIIMFKNLGDRLILTGEALYLVQTGLEVATKPTSVVGKVADTVTDFIPGLSLVKDMAKSILAKLGMMLLILAPYFILIGALMAIYIPMIPFITWMGGIVQYCVVVCQGLVGAPIAALSHMEAEGEGMGRRTEAGYMFVLNVTFRPALMLFGFFLASALLIVVGTFSIELFTSAMAGVQGNSITGLVSFAGFLTLFLVMNITLIQSLFNMIFLLPDQVLGLIGTNGSMTDMGKETEGKMHGVFANFSSATNRALGGKLPGGKPNGGDAKKDPLSKVDTPVTGKN